MAQLVAVFEPIVPMLSRNLVRVSIYGSTVNPFIAAVAAFRFFSILSCYVLSREGIRQTVFFCCRQHLTFLILTGPSSSTMAPSSSTMAPSYMLGISSLVSTLDLVCNTYLSVQAGLIRVIKIMKEVKLVYMIFILLCSLKN